MTVLPEDDLLGLIGKHPTQKSIKRWIAGLGLGERTRRALAREGVALAEARPDAFTPVIAAQHDDLLLVALTQLDGLEVGIEAHRQLLVVGLAAAVARFALQLRHLADAVGLIGLG